MCSHDLLRTQHLATCLELSTCSNWNTQNVKYLTLHIFVWLISQDESQHHHVCTNGGRMLFQQMDKCIKKIIAQLEDPMELATINEVNNSLFPYLFFKKNQ